MIFKRFFHIKKVLKPKKQAAAPGILIAEPHTITQRTWNLRLSSMQQLPIYRDYQRGNPVTLVRKIDGNVEHLTREISKFISKNSITSSPHLQRIKIKGDYLDVLRNWFTMNNK